MDVQLLTDRIDRGRAQMHGDVITVPDDEGRRMVACGQAHSVASVEHAEGRRSCETATTRKTKR